MVWGCPAFDDRGIYFGPGARPSARINKTPSDPRQLRLSSWLMHAWPMTEHREQTSSPSPPLPKKHNTQEAEFILGVGSDSRCIRFCVAGF